MRKLREVHSTITKKKIPSKNIAKYVKTAIEAGCFDDCQDDNADNYVGGFGFEDDWNDIVSSDDESFDTLDALYHHFEDITERTQSLPIRKRVVLPRSVPGSNAFRIEKELRSWDTLVEAVTGDLALHETPYLCDCVKTTILLPALTLNGNFDH